MVTTSTQRLKGSRTQSISLPPPITPIRFSEDVLEPTLTLTELVPIGTSSTIPPPPASSIHVSSMSKGVVAGISIAAGMVIIFLIIIITMLIRCLRRARRKAKIAADASVELKKYRGGNTRGRRARRAARAKMTPDTGAQPLREQDGRIRYLSRRRSTTIAGESAEGLLFPIPQMEGKADENEPSASSLSISNNEQRPHRTSINSENPASTVSVYPPSTYPTSTLPAYPDSIRSMSLPPAYHDLSRAQTLRSARSFGSAYDAHDSRRDDIPRMPSHWNRTGESPAAMYGGSNTEEGSTRTEGV